MQPVLLKLNIGRYHGVNSFRSARYLAVCTIIIEYRSVATIGAWYLLRDHCSGMAEIRQAAITMLQEFQELCQVVLMLPESLMGDFADINPGGINNFCLQCVWAKQRI